MNIGELKELIKDRPDSDLVVIQIESGRCCFSLCDNVDEGGYDEENVFLLCGEETSFGD